MRPSQLAKLLPEFLRPGSGQPPVYIHGPPGVGKSDCVRQAAARLGLMVIDLRVVLLDPIDIRGMPKLGAKDVKWIPPAFLPQKGEGVLFLDELAAAAPLTQASCLQLCLDRRVGEYELPRGYSIVAASNRVEDRAGAHRIISPLLNRFIHFDLDVDGDDWQHWAEANGVAREVRFFLKHRPALLHAFDPTKNERAFATPRSWAFASKVLSALEGQDEGLWLPTLAGTVGEGPALEFLSFLRVTQHLPTWADVCRAPDTTHVPAKADELWAMAGVLDAGVRKGMDVDVARAFVRYVTRLPREHGVIVMREAWAATKGQASCPFRVQPETLVWLENNKALVM